MGGLILILGNLLGKIAGFRLIVVAADSKHNSTMIFMSKPVLPACGVLLILLAPWAESLGNNQQIRTQDELEQLQEKIRGLENKMTSDHAAADSMTTEVDKLEREIADLARSLRKHSREQSAMQLSLQRLLESNQNLKKQKAIQIKKLDALVRSGYLMGKHSIVKTLMSGNNPHQTARRVAMMQYVFEARQQQLEEIKTTGAAIEYNVRQVNAQREALNTVIDGVQRDRQILEKKQSEKAAHLAALAKSLSDDRSVMDMYRKKERTLAELLKQLAAPSAKARTGTADSDSAKGGGREVDTATGEKSSEPVSGNQLLEGFAENRGNLALPVQAAIGIRFGQRKRESGLRWEGLLFRPKTTEKVHAVYQGQVVFSDWFRGYGQLVVLDHGEGFMSLYGYNHLLHVDLGEVVDQGQVIASVTPGQTQASPGLYFEIRHHGVPHDPLQWCRRPGESITLAGDR